MATIGLRDLYRAPITIGTSGAEEYGTPVRMAKAISAELSVEVAEAILYADDGADEVVKEFVSGEITLNVNDLLPADLAALLGQKQDTDKVVYGSDSDEAPYTAIGFARRRRAERTSTFGFTRSNSRSPMKTTPRRATVSNLLRRRSSDSLSSVPTDCGRLNTLQSLRTAWRRIGSLPFVSLTTRAVNRISKGGTAGSLKRLPALFCYERN